MAKKRKIIVQFGLVPPPYGGVSVHIQRLHEGLLKNDMESLIFCFHERNSKQDEKRVFFFSGKSKYFNMLLTLLKNRPVIIHDHLLVRRWEGNLGNNLFWLFYLIILKKLFSTKFVLSSGDGTLRGNLDKFSSLKKLCIKKILDYVDLFIGKNKEIVACVEALNRGVKTVCVPTLLPFKIKDNGRHIFNIQGFSPFLVTSGSFHDYYNFEIIIFALERLLREYPNAGLGMMISKIGDANSLYEEKILQLIHSKGLSGNVLFWKDTEHSVEIINNSDIFIRSSFFDGDSASVKEALYLGKPVIATDNGHRPEGVVLFDGRDVSILVKKMGEILENPQKYEFIHRYKKEADNNLEKILTQYGELIHDA